MEAPEISWRPLGQLFVEKGLLDEERLEHALAEQAAQRRPARREARRASLRLECGTGPAARGAVRRRAGRRHRLRNRPPGRARAPARQQLRGRTETCAGSGPRARRAVGAAAAESPQDDGIVRYAGLEEQWARLAAAEARVAELELELAAALERAEQSAAEAAFLNERLREQAAAVRPPPRTAPRPHRPRSARRSRATDRQGTLLPPLATRRPCPGSDTVHRSATNCPQAACDTRPLRPGRVTADPVLRHRVCQSAPRPRLSRCASCSC